MRENQLCNKLNKIVFWLLYGILSANSIRILIEKVEHPWSDYYHIWAVPCVCRTRSFSCAFNLCFQTSEWLIECVMAHDRPGDRRSPIANVEIPDPAEIWS
jgi:hypothetical protein